VTLETTRRLVLESESRLGILPRPVAMVALDIPAKDSAWAQGAPAG